MAALEQGKDGSASLRLVRGEEAAAPAPARNIDLVDFLPGHRQGVIDLWSKHFGEWSASRLQLRWQWQFDDNPWAKERSPRIVVGVDAQTGEVLAHLSSLPLPVRFNGKVSATLCAAGLVLEESCRFQTFGLMRRIMANPPAMASGMHPSVRSIIAAMGHHLLPLSKRRFNLWLGDRGRRTQKLRKRLRRPLAPLLRPWMMSFLPGGIRLGLGRVQRARDATRNIRVEPITTLDGAYDSLWQRASAGVACTVERDATYMTWRYLRCPIQRSTLLVVREGNRILGLAGGVVRTEFDWTKRPCVRFGEITELIVEPGREDVAIALISEMTGVLSRFGVDGVSTLGLQTKWHPLLRHLGFEEESADAWAMAVMPGPKGSYDLSLLAEDKWMCSAADGDSLYAATV